MNDMNVIELKSISLKNHPHYNEAWLQKYIADNPKVLGLGDLVLRAKEKIQSSGGRLDLLFEDKGIGKRYECELQLGAIDESHIIRTIEYWDIERKRYPQIDHVAVLVAEDVTSRFLNVIHLINGLIPLIVLKMVAFEIDGKIALTFIKILDTVQLGIPEEEDISEQTDRAYWRIKSNEKMLELTDKLFAIVQAIDSIAKMNYKKYYIGLNRNNVSANYCSFQPHKDSVHMIFKPIPSDEDIHLFETVGLDDYTLTKYNEFKVRIAAEPSAEQRKLIERIIKQSRDAYGV